MLLGLKNEWAKAADCSVCGLQLGLCARFRICYRTMQVIEHVSLPTPLLFPWSHCSPPAKVIPVAISLPW
jgi:hypothetical protein